MNETPGRIVAVRGEGSVYLLIVARLEGDALVGSMSVPVDHRCFAAMVDGHTPLEGKLVTVVECQGQTSIRFEDDNDDN